MSCPSPLYEESLAPKPLKEIIVMASIKLWSCYTLFAFAAHGADCQDFPWIDESFRKQPNELISIDHPCNDLFLDRLKDHPHLTRIAFYTKWPMPLPLKSFPALTLCQNLQDLILPGVHLGEKEACILTQLPKLTVLTLQESYIAPQSWPILSQLSNLKKLDISYSRILETSIPYLSQLTNLEVLNISHCNFSENHIQKLQGFLQCTKIIHNNT
ncbi:MAG TPA: hypothetical protein VNJ29_01750 [Candidatus Nitrosotenuis sp.]|jgi:Leucine-rich repeat (LRR) protein|nr:hypothetical protein [Candidatus Nitrosotenuis sp.]